MKIINLSSVPFYLRALGGTMTFHPVDGVPVRVQERNERTRGGVVNGVPVYSVDAGTLLNLPAPVADTAYIVDALVIDHPRLDGRDDVFAAIDYIGEMRVEDGSGDYACVYGGLRATAVGAE